MTDIIVNPNQITVVVTPSDNVAVSPSESQQNTVIETQVSEPQILINTLPFPQDAESAKEISFNAVAGETISATKLVYLSNDLLFLGSLSTREQAQVLGVALQAGNAGTLIKVLIFGRYDDPSFVFPSGSSLYLTGTGNISTTAPTSGYNKEVGQALANGSIFINIKQTITL